MASMRCGATQESPAEQSQGTQDGTASGRMVNFKQGWSDTSNEDAAAQSVLDKRGAGKSGGIKRPSSRQGVRVNAFTIHVGRTVDAMRGNDSERSYDDLSRILADIRKQYDEVHGEADRREEELHDIRNETRLLAVECEDKPEEVSAYSNLTREDILQSIKDVSAEINQVTETKKVYQHMVDRLQRELRIVQQKTKMMENHLARKTHEVHKRQERSRRVHADKVRGLSGLEQMEQEFELERKVCTAALDDLDVAIHQRKSEVRHREEFERWRYEVALEAATEAFQATAGRFQKIYAIEKLTGSCLQKIIFEQAEQSQNTEDGFQKIREVTGLTDVMDIVQKFLNRDMEHEQLQTSAREAEVRLHSLRESDANRQAEPGGLAEAPVRVPMMSGADTTEAIEREEWLMRAQRQREVLQERLRQETLLFDTVMQWSQRTSDSFASFQALDPIKAPEDAPAYFSTLYDVVDKFMSHASSELPAAQLKKLAGQAYKKEHAEQQRLLVDREFIRSNCRVPASLDPKAPAWNAQKMQRQQAVSEEERQVIEVQTERERLKLESEKLKSNHREEKGGLHREVKRLHPVSKPVLERLFDRDGGAPSNAEGQAVRYQPSATARVPSGVAGDSVRPMSSRQRRPRGGRPHAARPASAASAVGARGSSRRPASARGTGTVAGSGAAAVRAAAHSGNSAAADRQQPH